MKLPSSELTRARPLLGTLVEISIGAGEPVAALEAAFEEIASIHRLMSFHQMTSDVSRLNRAPIGEVVQMDERTYEVLCVARRLSAQCAAFDVTIGAQLVAAGYLPEPTGFAANMKCSYRDITMLKANRVMRSRAATIDLGGIAKGYAVDRAVGVLRKMGVCDGIVNAGGDLRTFGTPRPVHIRHPYDATKAYYFGKLANVAVASSSGVYNSANTHSAHDPLVDPRRGALLKWKQGITVMASTCIAADALTKVVRLAPHSANALLSRHGARAFAVGDGGMQALGNSALHSVRSHSRNNH